MIDSNHLIDAINDENIKFFENILNINFKNEIDWNIFNNNDIKIFVFNEYYYFFKALSFYYKYDFIEFNRHIYKIGELTNYDENFIFWNKINTLVCQLSYEYFDVLNNNKINELENAKIVKKFKKLKL